MPRLPRDPDDPFHGQTFWSRRGGRDLSAEVDYDRPCPVCHYNLRGLPLRSRCPECGSVGGWNLYDEPVAWDDTRTFGAFMRTFATAIFHPQHLARHVWCPQRLNLDAARRFRRICIAVASISLLVTAFVITVRAIGIRVALCSLPIDLIAIVVWLNAVTLEPLSRMKEWSLNTSTGRKVHVVVHYASATLLLSPLHIVLVLLWNDPTDFFWLLPAAIHLLLLMVQLWIASLVMGWLLYELVDMPAVQAHAMSLGPVFTATASAAVTVVAVPATMAMLFVHLVGN
jgi:hypothetical protein